ncbi:MAG: DUF4861 domain-containing protein, partial [Prevotellaceae bacterium]|nr:DUF4861 domain-containing protein [Prevotellaceae bacterium]
MKKTLYLTMMAAIMTACGCQKSLKITVANPANFDRLTELVEIPIDKVQNKITLTAGTTYTVHNAKGEKIPSQLTYDGKLIFATALKANKTASFKIVAGKPEQFPQQAYGHLIPERYDDFAWENDRVVFRIYGSALKAIDGPSNGIDLWYKRTNALVIDKWYKNDLARIAYYHDDNGEGLDDFSVGHSLGGGAMAPYEDGKLWLGENFVAHEVLDSGALRITFKLTYKNLDVNGKTISETRTISLDAGSQLTKVIETYGNTEAMTVAAGIVKAPGNNEVSTNLQHNYVICAQPPTHKSKNAYAAMLLPQGISEVIDDSYTYYNPVKKATSKYAHTLALTTAPPNTPITYYVGYGWEKFGFPTVADFEKYLTTFAESLK